MSTNMQRAKLIVEPERLWGHAPGSEFCGPSAVHLGGGHVLLVAGGGRPPLAQDAQDEIAPGAMRYLSENGGRDWRRLGPLPLDSVAGQPAGVAAILPLGGHRLGFLNGQGLPHHHGGALFSYAVSEDLGASFGPSVEIAGWEDILYVMNERLIRLRSGRLLFPASLMPPEGKYEGDVNVALAFFSDDEGRTWRRSRGQAAIADGGNSRGMAEPVVAELADGRLFMLARTGVGCHCASWSADGGDTWSEPMRTTLTAACSPLALKRLPDESRQDVCTTRLFVVYNHAEPLAPGAYFPRTPLCYAVSADDGQTWSAPVLIDDTGVAERNRQLIYPSVTMLPEGILLIYSEHAADPTGSFSNGGPDGWKTGGGKRVLIEYPSRR